MIADMVSDLEPYSLYATEQACAAWRRGTEPDNRFFPNSGQLIGVMGKKLADKPPYQALPDADRKYPKDLRPWRDILREHGRSIPPADSMLAIALDSLQPHP